MHQRIVTAVAALLFSLLAVVVGIMSDVHDRNFPEGIGASSSVYADFSRSGLSDQEAFDRLQRLSDGWHLRLVKVMPDLSGDQEGQVFAAVGSTAGLPARFEWYGDQPPGRIVGRESLAHSFATGSYLVTGDTAHLADLEQALLTAGVRVRREDDTAGQTLRFVFRQGSFRTVLLAGTALMVSLALYWLAVKAKARALRVLAGVSTTRIQARDLGQLLVAMLTGAVPVAAIATTVVRATKGAGQVPYYLQTLLGFDAFVLAVTMLVALAMSVTSWPSATMLATRQPATQSLRRVSGVLKGATFVLVLASAGPAWAAYSDAAATAAQQAQWRTLADEVALRYPGALGESGFQKLMRDVGDVVADAEADGAAALSYTITPDLAPGVGFGRYDSLALVNDRWLELMLGHAPDDELRAVDPTAIPASLRGYLEPDLEIWARDPAPGSDLLGRFAFYSIRDSAEIPFAAGGNGDLIFTDRALVMVAPSLHATFNDDFLASLSSSNNLVFQGLDSTIALLASRNLQHVVQVKYVAEDGILRAQFAEYMAWLRGISLIGLLTACAVSAAVGAFILAVMHARHDFPLRLAGRPWTTILRSRVGRELLVGGVLAVGVAPIQAPGTIPAVVVVALAALALSPWANLLATRWCFANVSLRRI